MKLWSFNLSDSFNKPISWISPKTSFTPLIAHLLGQNGDVS